MTLIPEQGILFGSKVLPGTDRVLRDPDAWWANGERGTVVRTVKDPTLIVGHWTAGHPHTGPDSARRVVRAMKARLRKDGSPMHVGIHFVVGWDGIIHQTANLSVGTIHVNRDWNRRGIGVECCWPGTERQALRLGVHGAFIQAALDDGLKASVLRPPAELIDAWVWLCEALSEHLPIPRTVPEHRGRLSRWKAKRTHGAVEHLHSPSTEKVDAGCVLTDALVLHGWDRA